VTLNPAQRGVVDERAQDILTLACAGAGKTRVLVERAARRIETDTPPWAIMALTFTNKAAAEMRERLSLRIGKAQAAQVWMGTFHAFGNRILQEFHEQAGFPEGVSLYDSEDVTDVLRLCIHTLGIAVAAKHPDAEAFRKAAADVKKAEALENLYRATLRRYAATDYDGLELHLLAMLENKHVIEHVGRYREISVDEYQDTNGIQEQILVALRAAVPRVRILRVGDVSQCIPGDEVVHTPAGPVKIRDIAEGDLVLGSRGGAESYRRVIRKSQSQKETAIRFHLDDGTTFDATPEHVCFAALADPVGAYVYLMYSPEHGFRMGVTQNSGTKASSIIMRTQQECADRLWILHWFETREQAVAENTRAMKALARELDAPVLLLAQLSRRVEQRGADARPLLSDLRESGSIEADADVVLFLHREAAREFAARNGGAELAMIVAKNRNGPTGTVSAWFDARHVRFAGVESGGES